MTSQKTKVIEYLFDQHWDQSTGSLVKSVMSLDDVADAIRACNKLDGSKRSSKNPANFLKDVVRSRSASQIWPEKLTALRYTGEQRTGAGDSFEFVRFSPGQTEPFPDLFRPSASSRRVPLQSVSIPKLAKDLGRTDEAWLVQTAVNLRVIEHHMATESRVAVEEIMHLQMNVKLRATEIDAIYRALVSDGEMTKNAIITCEAKKHSERILIGQITNQVHAAFSATAADLVIPIAIRSVRNEGIQVIEFEQVERESLDALQIVTLSSEVVYSLKPPVKGI